MKSIVLATLEYPPHKGGVATYLANVVAQFPKGCVQVLAPEGPKGPADAETHAADVASETPIWRRRLLSRWLRPRWLAALHWTDWLCRREHAELLVVSHLLPMGVVARLLKHWRGIPYAVIVHGMDVALALEAGGGKRRRAAAVLRDAHTVIANSAYTARLAETAGAAKDRIMIVRPCPGFAPYVTVTGERLAEVRAKYGLEKLTAPFTLLSLSRLVPRKGFADAIDAVAVLKKRDRAVNLVIAGDGPERKALEKRVKKKGVADRVAFTGRVPDEDLPPLYAAADTFVMASHGVGADVEGFGIVYLEASLMARPVIGSRTGGVPDAVLDGKTGLLVEPGAPEEIADAVQRLMDEPGLAARLGHAGRERVIAEFNWKTQAAPLVAALIKDAPGQTPAPAAESTPV